jgi:LysM repeat protein
VDTEADAARRARAARYATVPIVLAGTIAVATGLTGPVAAHATTRHHADEDSHRRVHDSGQDVDITTGVVFAPALARGSAVATPVVAVSPAPSHYTVVQGDTVSAIAARYGLSAQQVLVLNGLSWNTIIQPGQTLVLRPGTATIQTASTSGPGSGGSGGSSYHVVQGDTVSAIAARRGVSTTAILSANHLSSTSVIYPGQTLTIPSGSSGAASASPGASSTVVSSGASSSGASSSGASSSAKKVTIATGDTLASIAARYAVPLSELLAANGLTYTSTIYAGHSLVIPAGTLALSSEQRQNAETIVSVGRSLGVPTRGLVVALAAAMQESGLRNLPDGDRDSVGLFQQRPSQGWGTASQLSDPTYAAELFFGGPHNPNAGTTRGLLDIPGWESMSVTQAAQAVQVSAYPNAYGQWQQAATAWLATL